MSDKVVIEPLPEDWDREDFDLAIATVGYEERARFIFSERQPSAATKLACGFNSQQVFTYADNTRWFQSNGFTVDHVADGLYFELIQRTLASIPVGDRSLKVVVDISSTTRVRMAGLLTALRTFSKSPIEVSFVYALASFTPAPDEVHLNSHVGPVTPEFAGWWEEPDRALVAVVGLGYEQDKALGAVEHLQAAQIWTFTPASEVGEYTPALLKANRTLLESVPPRQQICYRVQDPYECFAKLESLVYGLSREKNPVLLPFGPKLFSLVSLLVAILYPGLPVWRVSAERHENPVNRKASGFVYGLKVKLP